jgi:hypothetical protein
MRVAQVLWAAPGGGDATFPGTARAGLARRAAVVALSAACAFASASPASAQQANGASSAAGEAPQVPASSKDEAQPAAAPPPYPYAYPYPPPGPPAGSNDADYKEQIRSTKQRMKEAEQNGDEAEKERLKEELGRLKAEYARYQKENYVRNSGGMMGGGIALASVGGFGLLVGSIFTLGNDDTRTTGYFLIGMGIACIGAGIPLAIVGARRVPKESREAGASPILIVSPRGAALHVTF